MTTDPPKVVGTSFFKVPVPVTVDSMRRSDRAWSSRRRAAGCGHIVRNEYGDEVECTGPPDWKSGGKWYCIDHIDAHLCCGSKLLPFQREAVMNDPYRARWIADRVVIVAALAAAEKAKEESRPEEVVAKSGFSYKEHKLRRAAIAEANRRNKE